MQSQGGFKKPHGLALELVYRAKRRCNSSGAPAGAFPRPPGTGLGLETAQNKRFPVPPQKKPKNPLTALEPNSPRRPNCTTRYTRDPSTPRGPGRAHPRPSESSTRKTDPSTPALRVNISFYQYTYYRSVLELRCAFLLSVLGQIPAKLDPETRSNGSGLKNGAERSQNEPRSPIIIVFRCHFVVNA